MSNCIVYYQLLYFRHTNPRDRRSESVSKQVEFWALLRRSPGNTQRLPAELFISKTSPDKAFQKIFKKWLNLSLLLDIYLGICSIAHDCTSTEKKRVVFQHDFVGKNIIDLAPVVQTSDSAIHWINHYPADSVIDFRNTYPLDCDLSAG